MKFDLPKDGKINPEPPGLMVVKDNKTAANYSDLFPEWNIISVTKITEKTLPTYNELFGEFTRIVFWHPAGYIKDPDAKRYTTVAKLALLHAEHVEVYGWANHDTVEDMMLYLPCLLPKVLIPTGKLKQHVVWEWRSSRYKRPSQVQVLKYSNTPENLAVIKAAFNN